MSASPRLTGPVVPACARGRRRSWSLAHRSTASSSAARASAWRPRRISSSPRTLGSRCEPAAGRGRPEHRPRPAPLPGPRAIDMATARFSATTADGASRSNDVVQQHDPVPVRVVDRRATAWHSAIAACTPYGAESSPDPLSRRERCTTATDRRPVPASPVLVLEQHGHAVSVRSAPGNARPSARAAPAAPGPPRRSAPRGSASAPAAGPRAPGRPGSAPTRRTLSSPR